MGWMALSVALGVGLGWALWRIRVINASRHAYRGQLAIAAPLALQANVGPLDILEDLDEWELLQRQGDDEGIFDGLGRCPCRRFYTSNTVQSQLNAWPNPAAIAQCNNNLPPVKAPDKKMCDDDCVEVLTHVWFGWSAWRSKKNGQLMFHCSSFGQYHCKKPNDPDRNKPPLPYHPKHPPLE
jgi:hypothetical protein